MYPLRFHPSLPRRWPGFPRHQQILMIANELNRAKNSITGQDYAEAANAYERAFELVDLTVESVSGTLRYELLRFREVLAGVYLNLTATTGAGETKKPESWQKLEPLIKILVSMDKNAYAALF